jgi:hypothetical protein
MSNNLDQIRKAHSENTSWKNSHHDCGILLGMVDQLTERLDFWKRRASSRQVALDILREEVRNYE